MASDSPLWKIGVGCWHRWCHHYTGQVWRKHKFRGPSVKFVSSSVFCDCTYVRPEQGSSNRIFATAEYVHFMLPVCVDKFYLRFMAGLLQCVALPGKRSKGESKKTETEVTFPDKDQIVKTFTTFRFRTKMSWKSECGKRECSLACKESL